ncbi:LacI family DNA-binding transcriptional regulator [Agrobacterium larrymoorei]|uniref:LacI family DNA-binding transcriptional regulator n=1 Tax=Agrobacterium larrymoorei TaxID=160699 RepID=A0AAF0KFX8_9HYPH|nr:LacI family DNA-binding transcriptional regulator [Agrobacterium larrymoorei]WHA43768.1 LacI family DNA-binding transcriptional regulator [Agrobacterium larrymoorei]
MKGIRQLAEHLDISIGTVSRALNGKADVNPQTRQRVLQAAEKLGYVANQSGRSLRKGSTGVIGFMMQTGPEITGQGDTFFMSVFDGVQTVLARHNLDLVALLCSSSEDPDAYLQRTVARGFADAIILSATRRNDARFELLDRHKIPFISLGRSLTDVGQPWIDLDFEGMADATMERFIRAGHREIGVIWPDGDLNLGYVFIERCRHVLGRHGLSLRDENIFRAKPSESGGYAVARQIAAAPSRPSAITLVNETLVTGLYKGLEESGLRPGKDIAIVGRHSPHTQFLSPSLTGFNLSLRDLGVGLAEALLSVMPAFQENYSVNSRQLWPMDLIEGESG